MDTFARRFQRCVFLLGVGENKICLILAALCLGSQSGEFRDIKVVNLSGVQANALVQIIYDVDDTSKMLKVVASGDEDVTLELSAGAIASEVVIKATSVKARRP